MLSENMILYSLVYQALGLFAENNDIELMERGGLERSISFRLGYYMQKLLDNKSIWDEMWKNTIVVDAEFNKNGLFMKEVFQNCKYNLDLCHLGYDCYIKSDTDLYLFEEQKNKMSVYNYVRQTSDKRYMVPDLIIHERMKAGNQLNMNDNLLALELKLSSDKNLKAKDFAKLSYLTCPAAEYQYRLGLFLDFSSRKPTPKITAFENGKIVSLPKEKI